ncbi:inositol monophosphatase family protein [Candidatus Kinetoplastidibacterium crithidiae]|uniref:Inositol-1-monophosphatase n=1 Tax=Candidatus Kinetoplastidibacterium crithidiae TCC036E TaxID=1208918 RepID=M1L3T9_9PROT|nr:inositol monophosphatase family protein [Candidatus Kinetoplastibacterium crithidii]AFZ83132.1 myo-inositol-1(or 4)-monophosphatase [Candidatus Kinetoplastibacterium crithidii (ex Angomonas deanei ATCC 30255)]AGF47408.1 myo-inositol-1(or 4)-monophosphatase [Candidatus Kinetoplastibacterium crithidii TCC036E]
MHNHTNKTSLIFKETDLNKLLNLAIEAALEGAKILRSYSLKKTELIITQKDNAIVTQADYESETAIITKLKSNTEYSLGFLAEESGQSNNASATWCIDPLDGTTNFLHGIPHYAISIALVAKKGTTINNNILSEETPILGVIYDPCREELFTSLFGFGSCLNKQKIFCSNKDNLSKSIIAIGLPSNNYTHQTIHTKIAQKITKQASSIRKMGSASLDLAWVACGRYDGYIELDLSPWDTAAGTVILREANGICEDILQQKPWPSNGWILASNSKLYKYINAELQDILCDNIIL